MTREIADHPKGPSRRRLAATVLGIFGIVGLGLGSASQVTLAANPLGAGATTIAPCQGSAPIKVTFTTTYDDDEHRFEATGVQLSEISAACNTRTYQFRVVTSGGALSPEEGGQVSGGVTEPEGITRTWVGDIVRVELVIP